jgi:DNA-binding HxlR family transcriptional regulator
MTAPFCAWANTRIFIEWYNSAHAFRKYAQFSKLGALYEESLRLPVQGTINVLSGKWKVLVVWHLGFMPRRFTELRDLLSGVSEKVLTAQLRQLEKDGVVQRKIKPSIPPQVTYYLTKAGDDLIPMMTDKCHWGSRHLGIPPNLPMIRRAKSRGRKSMAA